MLQQTHPQTHRGRKESGEVNFPGLSGRCYNCFLHMLLHWIHILLNTMFCCHSKKQTHKLINVTGLCLLHQCSHEKRLQEKQTGVPKRAFIFCLSSRVIRTHASDRVSFTIWKREVQERRGMCV